MFGKNLHWLYTQGVGEGDMGLVLGRAQSPQGRSACSFRLLVGCSLESSCVHTRQKLLGLEVHSEFPRRVRNVSRVSNWSPAMSSPIARSLSLSGMLQFHSEHLRIFFLMQLTRSGLCIPIVVHVPCASCQLALGPLALPPASCISRVCSSLLLPSLSFTPSAISHCSGTICCFHMS